MRKKGIIERSCIDGQKTYHIALEADLRAYISAHRSEFSEPGQEEEDSTLSLTLAELEQKQSELDQEEGEGGGGGGGGETSSLRSFSARHGNGEVYEHHRVFSGSGSGGGGGGRGIKSISRTYLGNLKSILSALWEGLLNLTSLLDGTTSSSIPIIVVGILLASNIYTLMARPLGSRVHPGFVPRPSGGAGGGSGAGGTEEVAMVVREVLEEWFKQKSPLNIIPSTPPSSSIITSPLPISTQEEEEKDLQKEAREMGQMIRLLEQRLRKLKLALGDPKVGGISSELD